MTPKEKAKEIFDKYTQYVVMWAGGVEVENQNCKQCALIAVDEIIKSNPTKRVKTTKPYSPFIAQTEILSNYSFWEEVKEEINKL